ncbi:hypothetical protein TPHA_0O01600 [Tetrapisispora phaffii CBS 4417]|uniref:Ketoreductase (KR) domain-containing protein n=1 Tax=Tetrapisispora phaffii (strain ATCC 24235 / CBS 4417 / NBRC 1672 / NRRL Y-8282 / UCD 70-5) TaxID=1071381 RepID=G8C1U9_TETPH|nr:hypothetical protein TPHA_0O01600 [Tetrapisispora phaffii CBS 4417]CCE66127.1 hypothetical protein TPHA_0O01600 [Tetrapisispora phaffii CBS 4417]
MPLNIIGTALIEGTDSVPYLNEFIKVSPFLAAGSLVKYWSRGVSNIWERNLHGKVFIVTGATSQSMGTAVVRKMAELGAQLIILTRNVDEWVTDWCEDLRNEAGNQLVYVEQCDISDLLQVRKFVTGWLDNSPPRRLDGVVIMSGDMEACGIPGFSNKTRKSSVDGLELQMSTNFAGIFHMLDLMQPSFKAQPPDRDVRIIFTTCFLQSLGDVNVEDPLWQNVPYNKNSLKFFASSKLQMSLCLLELQRRIFGDVRNRKGPDGVQRTGKNISFTVVQPGLMRSATLRRIISNGSVFSLIFLYCIILYPILWLFVKSGARGAETILCTLMTPELEEVNADETNSVRYYTECKTVKFVRKEFEDLELQKQLYDNTKKQIEEIEKQSAKKRNLSKKKR